jgi:hypothetical protein
MGTRTRRGEQVPVWYTPGRSGSSSAWLPYVRAQPAHHTGGKAQPGNLHQLKVGKAERQQPLQCWSSATDSLYGPACLVESIPHGDVALLHVV